MRLAQHCDFYYCHLYTKNNIACRSGSTSPRTLNPRPQSPIVSRYQPSTIIVSRLNLYRFLRKNVPLLVAIPVLCGIEKVRPGVNDFIGAGPSALFCVGAFSSGSEPRPSRSWKPAAVAFQSLLGCGTGAGAGAATSIGAGEGSVAGPLGEVIHTMEHTHTMEHNTYGPDAYTVPIYYIIHTHTHTHIQPVCV